MAILPFSGPLHTLAVVVEEQVHFATAQAYFDRHIPGLRVLQGVVQGLCSNLQEELADSWRHEVLGNAHRDPVADFLVAQCEAILKNLHQGLRKTPTFLNAFPECPEHVPGLEEAAVHRCVHPFEDGRNIPAFHLARRELSPKDLKVELNARQVLGEGVVDFLGNPQPLLPAGRGLGLFGEKTVLDEDPSKGKEKGKRIPYPLWEKFLEEEGHVSQDLPAGDHREDGGKAQGVG